MSAPGHAPRRRLLIVSPHFPPTSAPDMLRAVTALPHLRDLGWEAEVLAVDPRDVAAPRDESLLVRVPEWVPVTRVRAWPLALSRLVGLRSLARRARGGMLRAGREAIERRRPDLVLFTTTQWDLLEIGLEWKRRYRVPFAVDLQDPWVTDYYSRPGAPRPPGGPWKYAWSQRRARRLEPRIFREAAGFVSVSADYLTELGRRHSWFGTRPQVTIPFGVDEEAVAAAHREARAAFEREPNGIDLVSVGAVGPIMRRAIGALLDQLRQLHATNPELARRLRLHFIGTSYAPARDAQPSVAPLAAEMGLAELVVERPARVPWNVAQASMRAADGIVVLTSDERSYVPSKIAGCFLAGRPVLLVADPASAAATVGSDIGLGTLLDPGGSTPGALNAFLGDLITTSPAWPGRRRHDVFASDHTARARTVQLSNFLHRVASPSADACPA